MTMKFIENNTYTLQTDYYNSVKVVCTYVEDNTIWLSSVVQGTLSQACPSGHQHYKLDRKTSKLYHLNTVCSTWDSIENTLSEETVDDVWSKRMGNQSYSYDGMNQGD